MNNECNKPFVEIDIEKVPYAKGTVVAIIEGAIIRLILYYGILAGYIWMAAQLGLYGHDWICRVMTTITCWALTRFVRFMVRDMIDEDRESFDIVAVNSLKRIRKAIKRWPSKA